MNSNSTALQKAWGQEYEIQLANKSIRMKPADIPRLLRCEKATIEECVLFLKQCQQYGADPFMRDMYIIKYGTKPASIVSGVGFFQKKAQRNPKFEGYTQTEWLSAKAKKWVSVWIPSMHGKNPLACRVGCHVKGYREKQTFSVNWEENSKDTPIWNSMPSRMLEKVAFVGLLRQTFPDDFRGLYLQEEIDGHTDNIPPAVETASEAYSEQIADAEVIEAQDLENVKKAQEYEPKGVKTVKLKTGEELGPPDIICKSPEEEKKDDSPLPAFKDYQNTPNDPSLFGKRDARSGQPEPEDEEIPF